MRLKAYLLVFDGLADWEPALALCEIVRRLKIHTHEEIRELYGMFKHGAIPDRYAV
nr:hypothetical protein [Desulfobacula sp.]